MYARRFKLQQTCKFVVSDESPIYNIAYSTKKGYLSTDARRFELQQPFGCRECRISIIS